MSEFGFLISAFQSIIIASTPLVFAALGELVSERAGVLNLGVEGMMIMGAVVGFGCIIAGFPPIMAFAFAALAGLGMALLFGIMTLFLYANAVATGLALTLFGLGLSALIGSQYVGLSAGAFPKVHIPVLSDLPIVGPLLFSHDALVYVSLALAIALIWFFKRTRAGLIVRAVGDDHDAAHAIGYNVVAIRMGAVLFGGAMAGLGGAYLSVVQTPLFIENMTAGRGWIALALVVFASWRPGRVLLGAYLFGGITIIQLHVQGFGIAIPSQILSMLPYLATIVVLTVISARAIGAQQGAPRSLGKIFKVTR
ncbi:ABC transporter permease [Litorivicinus lipolyticus]|uniref:ABC transporter permease n=1 Tax=Litorivicinus lipolyticus TaxID=418701 RepID=A0A5Q2QFJ6_9GAMM|nr:ABC transporter permease [Litorivicinus lipolyticus]QGG81141.1 ABC transporter permease [Litorivicinus lipolyticus]